jgi:hypothetical protein
MIGLLGSLPGDVFDLALMALEIRLGGPLFSSDDDLYVLHALTQLIGPIPDGLARKAAVESPDLFQKNQKGAWELRPCMYEHIPPLRVSNCRYPSGRTIV